MIKLLDLLAVDRETAIDVTYRLLQERPPEANISHDGKPNLGEHIAYVSRYLARGTVPEYHPYVRWKLIYADHVPVGSVSATQHNEIGVAILREHQRKGYARAALHEFMVLYPPLPAVPGKRRGCYIANIAPGNTASIALFAQFGARLVQQTYTIEERT